MVGPCKFVDMELVCALSDEEVMSRGLMFSETVATVDGIQSARAEAMKQFKERLTGLSETQRKLARVIKDRVETRLVRCLVHYHSPCEGIKRTVRTDTGEVVSEMPMSDAEKQLNLFASTKEFEKFMQDQAETSGASSPESEDDE